MSNVLRVLLELRPALEGYSGIPQESRLLFRNLARLEGIEITGLVQSSANFLAAGLSPSESSRGRTLAQHEQLNRLSKVVVSLHVTAHRNRGRIGTLGAYLTSLGMRAKAVTRALIGQRQKLTFFDPTHFTDFLWRSLFAKTLPSSDLVPVTRAKYRIAQFPYGLMHATGLLTRKIGLPRYPRLDTRGVDVFLAMTPYPATVEPGTRLVIRYFDAVPLLLPHTIVNKVHHQALHYEALRQNFAKGAWFVCCSEATRQDLLSIFPEAADRAVTIHCMLSHHYHAEPSSPLRIREILAKRRNPRVAPGQVDENPFELKSQPATPINYLVMVSTIEPRKNHLTLLAAWEQLKSELHRDLKLVIVGSLGWEHEAITERFRPWVERGEVFILEDVPGEELRLLYMHARATVCPSYAEGFNYSGVEAMRCGGVVAASDILVHREVYDTAAEYFSPYSVDEAADAIHRIIDPGNAHERLDRVTVGGLVANRYTSERILPQWQRFFDRFTT